MPIANNVFTGAILAPLLTFLAAISLATVQRGIEWVASVAKNPQKGFLRQIRPYAKHADLLLERLLGGLFLSPFLAKDISKSSRFCLLGSKFAINTTNILLMAVIILLIALLLEGSSSENKTKRLVVVDRKKSENQEEADKKRE